MSNLMNRSFSRREKLLMIILVLILLVGLYFFVVHYPIEERMDEIADETDEVLFQAEVANQRFETYNMMKSELDEIFKMPEDELTVLPKYPNKETLLLYFNTIFAGTDMSLNFDAERTLENDVVERAMRFSFTANSYEHAREVLTNLTGTGYRCLMDAVSFAPVEGGLENGSIRVSGTITFYELNK